MRDRKASIKETGEELSREDWERFDAAVAAEKRERPKAEPFERGDHAEEPGNDGEQPPAS